MFDEQRFHSLLETGWLGRDSRLFGELESTNTHLKKLPAEQIGHGTLCLADHQTRGRGQYERRWESAPGENLTFTLCFRPPEADRLHVLTLAAALGLLRQAEEETGGRPALRWPNDLLLEGRKCGGLLTEAVFSGNRLDRVLVGIGLNVNQSDFPEELQEKATSLRLERGQRLDREAFLARFLARMEYLYVRWHKRDVDLLREINQTIVGYGEWLRLEVNGQRWEDPYKFVGVNEQGRLLVVDEEGELKSFSYEQIRLVIP